MKGFSNECGSRNAFGYFDACAKEIILKRPCLKKQDASDVYFWLDSCDDLQKFALGIGGVEVFLSDSNTPSLYSAAKDLLKQSLTKTKTLDADILNNLLLRLKNHKKLRNLALKCVIFNDDEVLFKNFIDLVSSLKHLVYLDLTGCFFSENQLIQLAQILAQSTVAHIVWPELSLSPMVLDNILKTLKDNKSLVVISGAPAEMKLLAKANRDFWFAFGRFPDQLSENDEKLIKKHKDSIILAFAFEKEKLFNLEKTFMAILAEAKGDGLNPFDNSSAK